FQGLGRAPQAVEAFSDAVRLQEELLAESPGDPTIRNELAETLRSQGISQRMLGRLDLAAPLYFRDHELVVKLVREFPSEPKYAESLAESFRQLGFLSFQQREPRGAEAYFSQSVGEWDKLGEAQPANFNYAIQRARAYHDLAYFHYSFR